MPTTLSAKDFEVWRAAVHESGHVLAFLACGVVPFSAHALSNGNGRVLTTTATDDLDEESLQIIAVIGAKAEELFANGDSGWARMSPDDHALYASAGQHVAADERTFQIRASQAESLCRTYKRPLLDLAERIYAKVSIGRDQIKEVVFRHGIMTKFRPLFANIDVTPKRAALAPAKPSTLKAAPAAKTVQTVKCPVVTTSSSCQKRSAKELGITVELYDALFWAGFDGDKVAWQKAVKAANAYRTAHGLPAGPFEFIAGK